VKVDVAGAANKYAMNFARWLPLIAAAVLLAGCGSPHRYTVSEVKQAFTRAGFHHPKVQTEPPGTIFNYGKPPHTVSVSVYSGAPLNVVFPKGLRGYRVARTRNVMVYYSEMESGAVERAMNLLK
jgi:hypothetical protein